MFASYEACSRVNLTSRLHLVTIPGSAFNMSSSTQTNSLRQRNANGNGKTYAAPSEEGKKTDRLLD